MKYIFEIENIFSFNPHIPKCISGKKIHFQSNSSLHLDQTQMLMESPRDNKYIVIMTIIIYFIRSFYILLKIYFNSC